MRDEALTGATAAKVKAAALDEVPGGTVLRTEKGGPGNAAYHAHVRKSNGTEVVVLVNSAFEATSVQTRPAGGPGGHRGDHGPGGPRGEQTALTGDTAAKVKAAALDKVPGGTVLRTETGRPRRRGLPRARAQVRWQRGRRARQRAVRGDRGEGARPPVVILGPCVTAW